jgi:hypothetical protein
VTWALEVMDVATASLLPSWVAHWWPAASIAPRPKRARVALKGIGSTRLWPT